MISLKRLLSPVVVFSFIIQSSFPIYAAQNSLLNLPEPGKMISLSSKFVPAYVKGISIYPNDPFKFDFIIDTGNTKLNDQQFKDESNKLIKYFMAALTVPEKEDWVNLSPYEKDRIIPESLGITEMGRDMLAQDYILKQLTSSLIYPEKEIGKEFWSKVYAQAQKQFGTTNIPVNTFNKVWIVPSQAVVWEHDNSAYVVRSHLKVMLEQDYLSLNKHLNNNIFSGSGMDKQDAQATNAVGSDVVRAVVLPALEKEVNEGANFATLRQVFNSAILAAWYKQNLKQSILGQVYANKDKVAGIDLADRQVKQKIYERYLQAFKKGAFNFIREDNDPVTHQTVPRKYFSGGMSNMAMTTEVERGEFLQLPLPDQTAIAGATGSMNRVTVAVVGSQTGASQAMLADSVIRNQAKALRNLAGLDNKWILTAVKLAHKGAFWGAGRYVSESEVMNAIKTLKRDPKRLKEEVEKITQGYILNQVLFPNTITANEFWIKLADNINAYADAAMMVPVVSKDEEKVYRQIQNSHFPSGFGANLAPYGLTWDQLWMSEVDPATGKLTKPSFGHRSPFENLATMISISSAIAQALAGASAPGTLEQVLGKAAVNAGIDFGKEIDARAVKVGRESLEIFAKLWDIVIIVGGNEGGFRDQSKDMPIGLIINPYGKKGVYMYFGDSVEVTNGVKTRQGRPGTSSMFTLVPLMMPSTDGYRISMAVDKFNPGKPFPKIDPIITSTNTLRHVLEQLAAYMDASDVEAFIKEMASEYKIVTLNRPRHDQLKAQAKDLEFEVAERDDGDPLLFIRALLGIKGEDGKKLFAFSTGGSNEHIMSMILAALYKKALMTSTYAATITLRAVDKEFDKKGPKAGGGSLERAREFATGDLENYKAVNDAFNSLRHAGFDVPQAPVTSEQLKAHLLTPDSPELDMLGQGLSSMVTTSITGANQLDWGVLRPYIQPVTWTESKDGSGRAVVSGFFINNNGKVIFFRAGLKSKDILESRYSFVAANDLEPNPLITQYEKTRKPYKAMLEANEIDQRIITAHVENIQGLLKDEEGAKDVLKRLGDAFTAQQRNVVVEEELVLALREVEKYILGSPSVTMEDGTVHKIVQRADAAQVVDRATVATALTANHYDPGGINLDAAMYNMQVLRDGKGMMLPISQQPIGQFMKIKGFKPVLLNIERNINLPARLGVNLNRLPKEQLAEASSVAG